eukprot:CAMPEP_0172629518 /NCGR_PEP_ID=MMETSP1068-20121228/168315_1 /TAXON_ID=35684 /ORGANISM="Pseudopedinella elastica, Strain CCMP716" /LENGTH=41 /DNA_ID= /DNA_START= /DNA_END= /DNA_ORIENTATION=
MRQSEDRAVFSGSRARRAPDLDAPRKRPSCSDNMPAAPKEV